MKWLVGALALGLATITPVVGPQAAGNLAQIPATRLVLDINTKTMTMSQTEFQVETGKYYRLTITTDGVEQVLFHAPDLFRNIWINQIVSNGIEMHVMGPPNEIRVNAAQTVFFAFVAVRPGDYEFWAEGYQNLGLRGKFIVR